MKILTLMAALALGCGAAQLSQIKGNVTVRPENDGTWTAAAGDTPLPAGSHIATGARSEANVEIGPALSIRLHSMSEVWLERLNTGDYRLSVAKGSITCYVAPDFAGRASVATPNITAGSALSGIYRIAVKPSGQSEIAADQGAIQVTAPGGSEWVNAGRKLVARGPATDPEYKIGSAVSFWRRLAFVMAAGSQAFNIAVDATAHGGGDHREERAAKPSPEHTAKPAPAPVPSPRNSEHRVTASDRPAQQRPSEPGRSK